MNYLEEILKLLKAFYRAVVLMPFEIELPRHQHIPKNAESLDIEKLCEVKRNTEKGIFMTLKAPRSQEIIITHYAIYTDAEDPDEIEFFFDLNGNKQLRYHGVPDDSEDPKRYSLNLNLAPDLSNNALKSCYIVIKPTQTLTVKVKNSSSQFDRPMGARLVGYVNNLDARKDKAIR